MGDRFNGTIRPPPAKAEPDVKLDGAEFLKMLESAQISKYIHERFKSPLEAGMLQRQERQEPPESPQKPVRSQKAITTVPGVVPDNDLGFPFATPINWLVVDNEETHVAQIPHVFSLAESLPWTPRVIMKCLQRAFGTRAFKLYDRSTRVHEASGEYFVEMFQLPLDFDPVLCLVGPEFRAGHQEQGFYAKLTSVAGFCKHCQSNHEGKLCRLAKLIDTQNIKCATFYRDLLAYHEVGQIPVVGSLLD